MERPIFDFIKNYSDSNKIRLHMPGHKGKGDQEAMDITEIPGADSLYSASGIISASEQNAGQIFGADTFYSAEGSSLAIRAMLYLAMLYAKAESKPAKILAGRNAHKTFLSAVSLLGIDVAWIGSSDSYLSCNIDEAALAEAIENEKPSAVYITSPDYLGNIADIKAISAVCKRCGVLLLVDNAHGSYLKFLPDSLHPMDLGAHMCCDSAHKTLPVLTGGAYLHISKSASPVFRANAKSALSLFGSTSPSYLILRSLDMANPLLEAGFAEGVKNFIPKVNGAKEKLADAGYKLCGSEPLKVTLAPKSYGYTGTELADMLNKKGIVCEFADKDYIVFMLSPADTEAAEILAESLLAIPKREAITLLPPAFKQVERVLSPRDAALSPVEEISVDAAEGRILAASDVACPPAVPILAWGEKIDRHAIECFKYYGIRTCRVIKE